MKTKTFDAVKLMRELRDKLSRQMERMSPAERVHFIQAQAALTALGKISRRGDSSNARLTHR